MASEIQEVTKLKWWDWVLSPPPVAAFYVGVWLVTYFVAIRDPWLEGEIREYGGYACLLVVVAWGLFSVRRLGWSKCLPFKLCRFWLLIIIAEYVVWRVVVGVLDYLSAGGRLGIVGN